jgi:hypothetical protein
VNVHQLAPDEPLSPELVLVFPPELRAQALARLGPPVRHTPPPRRLATAPPAVVAGPQPPSLGVLVVARVGQLALIFVAVTLLTLLLSVVAQAMR